MTYRGTQMLAAAFRGRTLALRVLMVVILLGIGLSACSTVPAAPGEHPPPSSAGQNPRPATVDVTEDYALGAGDKLRVIVFGEDNLGGQFAVDQSGMVRLPLIGQVRAAGLSVHQFERNVEAALADGYLRSPRVSVEVTSFRPFYILGEVKSPGEYAYVNNMTLLNAVALAGGYTYRAKQDKVYIRRNGTGQEVEVNADGSTRILPGDVIRVKERFF